MDFTTYVEPGVYVEQDATPVVVTTGVPASVACIVGPALGYQTYTEGFPLFAATPYTLTYPGVYQPGAEPSGAPRLTLTKADGTPLVQDTDYTLTVVGTGRSAQTQIERVTASTLLTTANEGIDIVVASYAYTDDAYFTPQTFQDFQSVVDTYGAALSTSPAADPTLSQVLSPLTFATQIHFQNGAGQVVLVALDPATTDLGQRFTDAYAKTLAHPEINLLVPLFVEPSGSDLHSASVVRQFLSSLTNHLEAAEGENIGRVAVVGLDRKAGTSGDSFDAIAKSINYRRQVLAYPNQMLFYNGSTNQTTIVDGYYHAAALAGRLAYNPVQQGLTKEPVRGFSGIPASVVNNMTRTFKNNLSRNGVCVTEQDRNNSLTVRHGLTTDMSSLLTREISIVRTEDVLMDMVLTGMGSAGLIGKPITEDTPINVKGAATGILETAMSAGVILDYSSLAVRQQVLPQGDPSVIEIKFAYKPSVPLNYIVVSFGIDMSTGDTVNLTPAAA